MRRKNLLNKKTLQVPKKYFDKLFYMNMLFKRISFKKYKSANRRILIPNFIFFNFFLKQIKFKFYLNFFRKYMQTNILSKIYFSGPLISKRIFNTRIDIDGFFKNQNSHYLLLNNPFRK